MSRFYENPNNYEIGSWKEWLLVGATAAGMGVITFLAVQNEHRPKHEALRVMKALEENGYESLIVGGAVRDILMNKTPKDWDIATNATPEEVEEVISGLPDYHTLGGKQAEIAKSSLTSLVIPPSGEQIEVTTYRAELGYEPNTRKPIAIPATSFKEDSKRRDLTINAMGMTREGKIVDYWGGEDDIKNKVIRTVGNPDERFAEDPLRILRSIRFATRNNSTLTEELKESIARNKHLLHTLSPMRVRSEIGKILTTSGGFDLLVDTGVLQEIIPEFSEMESLKQLKKYHPEGNVLNHYRKAFETFNTIEDREEISAWGLLFHDIGKVTTAQWDPEVRVHRFYGHEKDSKKVFHEKYRRGPIHFTNDEADGIEWMVETHMSRFWETTNERKGKMIGEHPYFDNLCQVAEADSMHKRKDYPKQFNERKKFFANSVKVVGERTGGGIPKGYGKKIMKELNLSPGPLVGSARSLIEVMVEDGECATYDEALAKLKANPTLFSS